MPFIHVRSLPLEPALKPDALVEGLTMDFARQTGIGPEHVAATWEFIAPGHYAVGGRAADRQPADSHPVLVDLLTPDFNSPDKVEVMLKALAASLSQRTGVPMANIFINCRQAHSGAVFDEGRVARW